MDAFSKICKRQSSSMHESRLLEVMSLGGLFQFQMRHLEPQGDLQVISLLIQNVYFLREARGGYSTAPCGFKTGGHVHATNHFLSANELMMFSQPSP